MSDQIDKIITHRNMRYIPWYAFGILGGSITFLGASGLSLIYTVFITTLFITCCLKSYYDYHIDTESNFVIKNVNLVMDTSKVSLTEAQYKTHNKKLRLIYNISMMFKTIMFLSFMLIISIFVNATIFYNPAVMMSSVGHIIIACIVYYMVSFLLKIMSIIKYKEV